MPRVCCKIQLLIWREAIRWLQHPHLVCANAWLKVLKPHCVWPKAARLLWKWTAAPSMASMPSLLARNATTPSVSLSRVCFRSTHRWALALRVTVWDIKIFLILRAWWRFRASVWPAVQSRAGTVATRITSRCWRVWPSTTSSTLTHRLKHLMPPFNRCCCMARARKKSNSTTAWNQAPMRAKNSARSTPSKAFW